MSKPKATRTQIFISHVAEDRELALRVQEYVEVCLASAHGVFCSSWQLSVGDFWVAKIRKELKHAKAVIVLLSRQALKSTWIAFETGAAWSANKKVILLCVGGVRAGRLPRPYSDFHAIDLTAHPEHHSKILESIISSQIKSEAELLNNESYVKNYEKRFERAEQNLQKALADGVKRKV
jgi:hypothetical protein